MGIVSCYQITLTNNRHTTVIKKFYKCNTTRPVSTTYGRRRRRHDHDHDHYHWLDSLTWTLEFLKSFCHQK
jgi:hypothetical protein